MAGSNSGNISHNLIGTFSQDIIIKKVFNNANERIT